MLFEQLCKILACYLIKQLLSDWRTELYHTNIKGLFTQNLVKCSEIILNKNICETSLSASIFTLTHFSVCRWENEERTNTHSFVKWKTKQNIFLSKLVSLFVFVFHPSRTYLKIHKKKHTYACIKINIM